MDPLYSERLHAPLRWWVQATMFVASVWLACLVALPFWVATAVLALGAALTSAFLLRFGGARVRVTRERLEAGRASIPPEYLGDPEELDAEGTRRRLGPEADARAYLLTRPYLKRSVLVPIEDPRDPAPYWLLSTRRPAALADAVRRARAGAAPAASSDATPADRPAEPRSD